MVKHLHVFQDMWPPLLTLPFSLSSSRLDHGLDGPAG